MNRTTTTSTPDQAAALPFSQYPVRGQQMDTVRVAPDNFQSPPMFMGAQARKEFTQDNRPASEKPQKRTAQGVPVWSVTVAAVNFRGKPEMVTFSLAMLDDPSAVYAAGQPVEVVGLTFGVTPKRDGSGYSTWCSADDLRPVGVPAKAAS